MTELTAADGHKFSVYRADPPEAPKGAVVVLQEAFGVNGNIRKVADSLVASGYVALAPALFDRVAPGTELGYDDASLAKGLELVHSIPVESALADIQATVNEASTFGKVALLGYSWGAALAYEAANQVSGLTCVVGYYGGGIADSWLGKRRTPTLLHFGKLDESITYEKVILFRAGRADVCVFDYPTGGHGFANDERPTYNAEAAALAQTRTLDWISQFLVGVPKQVLKNAGAYAATGIDRSKKKKPAKPAGGDDPMGPPP